MMHRTRSAPEPHGNLGEYQLSQNAPQQMKQTTIISSL